MFTGIIHHRGVVRSVSPTASGVRLTIAAPVGLAEPDAVRLGDSIATNGVCLTVAAMSAEAGGLVLGFDAVPETLALTNLGALGAGDQVHLERSLRAGDRVDGHFVQGHVDGTAELVAVSEEGGEWRGTLVAPAELARYLVPKGSVALDGVSLTLAKVEGGRFEIALIPTTLQLTTLGSRLVGYRFNLECDATVKTIVATLERLREVLPGMAK